METSALVIFIALISFIIFDLFFNIKSKRYSIILFSLEITGLLVLMTFLIMTIAAKESFYQYLVFLILGTAGVIRKYYAMKKQKVL